jgi:hypothetical protein
MVKSLRRLRKALINRAVDVILSRHSVQERTSAATKIAVRQLFMEYARRVERSERLPTPRDAGLRIFSQFDEDGILLLLLAASGISTYRFVDIGAGDGITGSNTANLALNLGFDGVMLDGDPDRVRYGRRFYGRHPDTRYRPPRFEQCLVTPENVDHRLTAAGIEGEVDVLSIDIDGNDYWVWKAIQVVSPRIVLIEAHPHLGPGVFVSPYVHQDELAVRTHGATIGASPAALDALAVELGYRRVATNRYGFNVFYLRTDLAGSLF